MRSHPWRAFVVALAISLVVAVGFAVVLDRVAAARQPAPHLQSVSQAALAASGLTLSAAALPPYCGAADAATWAGWLHAGSMGCAISREAAVAAAGRFGSMQVVESLLARVTATGRQPVLRDRLAWLVVVRGGMVLLPAIACFQPAPTRAASGCSSPGTMRARVVRVMVLDAHTADIVYTVLPGVSPPAPGTGMTVQPVQPGGQALPSNATRPAPPMGAPVVRVSPQARLVPPAGG
jgi:hypothetical protein